MIRRPRGLRWRLVAGFVGISVLATVLVGATALLLRRAALLDEVTQATQERFYADLQMAAATVNEHAVHVEADDAAGLGRYRVLTDPDLAALGRRLSEASEVPVLIWQPADREWFRSHLDSPIGQPSELQSIVGQGLIGRVRVRIDGRPTLIVGARVASDALHVYRFVDLTPIDRELQALGRTIATAGAVPVLVALVVGSVAAAGLIRPLRRARDAARRFGDGDHDVRLPVTGNDELAELSRSFNDMAASLQGTVAELVELEARQRQFVADVSHELRTPLTALVASVEVLEDDLRATVDGDADRRAATLLTVDEVRALRELVEDLMEISRFDAGRAVLQESPIDLAAAIGATLRRRGWHDVHVAVPGGLRVWADARRLDTIVANLVGNARTHGAAPVEVRVAAEGADVLVDVVDHGPGIPAELRDQLFERFVKGDQARQRTGGSGLGLSIARENARLHGGDLRLRADGTRGARFRLELPGRRLVGDAAAPDSDAPDVAVTDGHVTDAGAPVGEEVPR